MSGTILGFDYVTGPPWLGKFGGEGWYLRTDTDSNTASLPSHLSGVGGFRIGRTENFNASPPTIANWTQTIGRMVLPDGVTTSKGIFYSSTGIAVVLNTTNSVPHLASLYFWEGDGSGRRFRAEVWDYANTTKYSELTTPSAFTTGMWCRVAYQGPTVIKIYPTVGNTVLSGVLFDGLGGSAGFGAIGHSVC